MKFYLALGSNLGDRHANLRAALDGLEARGIRVTKRSSVYETVPVGGPPGQAEYLNQVVEVEADFSARGVLDAAHEIESGLGRDRSQEARWGPRVIDIDIVLGGPGTDEPGLTVPHPRAADRAFVVVPLAEIAPDALLAGRTAGELRDGMDLSGVRRLA